MYKRIISFTLLCLLCLPLLACGREYTEDEVFPAAKELIEKSNMLNVIYFGTGIPVKAGGETEGSYTEADMSALQEMGFTDAEDIKKQTEQVFSSSMCRWLFEKFSSSTQGANVTLARYIQLNGKLMVYTEYDVLAGDQVTYDYSTLKIHSQGRGQVKVTLDATATRGEGLSRTENIDVTLVKVKGGWRLDAPTYLVYN